MRSSISARAVRRSTGVETPAPQPGQHLQTVHLRHHDVQDNAVVLAALTVGQGVLPVVDGVHLISVVAQMAPRAAESSRSSSASSNCTAPLPSPSAAPAVSPSLQSGAPRGDISPAAAFFPLYPAAGKTQGRGGQISLFTLPPPPKINLKKMPSPFFVGPSPFLLAVLSLALPCPRPCAGYNGENKGLPTWHRGGRAA